MKQENSLIPHSLNRVTSVIPYKPNRVTSRFLTLLRSATLARLETQFNGYVCWLHYPLQQAHRELYRNTFFSQQTPTRCQQNHSMPDIGKNASELNKIEDFDTNQVPNEYCCRLSLCIMTDPVYDPAHPKISFEKSWILKALSIKSENPFTRTPLEPEELVSDEQLKEEIDGYVRKIIELNNQKQDVMLSEPSSTANFFSPLPDQQTDTPTNDGTPTFGCGYKIEEVD